MPKPKLGDWILSLDDPNEKEDYGNHEKDMDE